MSATRDAARALLRVPLAFVLLALVLAGCASNAQRQRATVRAETARDERVDCTEADRCAIASPYARLVADAAAQDGRHFVNLLDRGEQSLALRVHLVRAARERIDVQTFIFTEDDVGYLMLDELIKAARRGVKVRVLSDQLYSIGDTELLAKLARAHANFELRLYNPTFKEAKTAPLEFAAGILCCFLRTNQRMHNKLMLFDGAIGINGGRNIDERYFDWSDAFNYRDRDVLVVGPAAVTMQESFDGFWQHETAVPLPQLGDVSRSILAEGDDADTAPALELHDAARILAISRRADDQAWIAREFAERAFAVGKVEYFSDLPGKLERKARRAPGPTARIIELLGAAQDRIVMQTPYLVLSRRAREVFRERRVSNPDMEMIVSTNSLAATDAFYVYAISHKHKRKYLKKLGFQIYEYKPFPVRGAPSLSGEPVRVGASGTFGRAALRARRESVPLTRPGVRRGLHAKSIVIDGEVALIGTHNFDPRSDDHNTESGVIVWDATFAQVLEASIREDIAPENSWVVAPRKLVDVPVVGTVNSAIATVSETLPLFDLWPFRYATSYELKEGCERMPASDPKFQECHVPVGDFPEVNLSLKAIYSRIITAFGVGLTPIL